jgi:hypothetical protein
LTVDADDVLKDLDESVSILLKDGTEYSFILRSFQEYFVAVFLSERQVPQASLVFNHILNGIDSNVLELLMEINRESFETKYFNHQLRILIKDLKQIDIKLDKGKIFAMVFDKLTLENGSLKAALYAERRPIIGRAPCASPTGNRP